MTADPQKPDVLRPSLKVTRGWIVRVVLSAVMLAGLFWYLPMGAVWDGFSRIEWSLFLLVLLCFMLGHAVAAAKWWMLLGAGFPYLTALRAHFAGLAANLCLPGVAGGDVVRAGLVARDNDVPTLTAASLSDRLIDMLALALVAISGLLMLQNDAGSMGLAIKIAALFAVALAGAFYVMPRVLPLIYAKLPALPMRGFALKTSAAFGDLGRRPLALLAALGLSVAIQAGFVTLFIWLANAAGVVADAGAWFFAWPLAKILAVLPISLGGIGLREASLAALMTPFGAEAALVVVASLIWQAVLIVAGLIGALAWAMSSPGPVTHTKHSERKEA